MFAESQEDLGQGPLPTLGEEKRDHAQGGSPYPLDPQGDEEERTQHWTGWEDERGGYSICDVPRQAFGTAGVCQLVQQQARGFPGVSSGREPTW